MDANGTDISLCVCYCLILSACAMGVCCVCANICGWMLWVTRASVHALDVDNVCVLAVCSHFGSSYQCMGLKAPVSEGVSGGHLNRICSRIA